MIRTHRRLLLLALALVGAAFTAAPAGADGLPVLGIDVGPQGIAARAQPIRYVTLPARRDTLVARVDRHGGQVLGSLILPGTFTIPAVAYDGSASGLSADGKTLVLIEPRVAFPRANTRFALIDALHLAVRRVITLPGDFSFDAISPRGAWIYLIQYVAPNDPTRYAVRALDTRSGRLAREPVVDPRERGEAMRGAPVTRATSADGRWAYTLYDGGGKTPFVHALDTRGRTARCVDLDMLPAGADLSNTRLALTGETLAVTRGRVPVANVDLATFRVTTPPAAATPDGGGFPVLPAAAVALALLVTTAAFAIAIRRGRRAPVPTA